MLDGSLQDAVEQFVEITQGTPDSELSREWAWGAYDEEGVRFAFFRTYEELCELATKLAALRAGHGPPPSAAQRILAQYHTAYRDLQGALLGIDDEMAEIPPAKDEWSVRETLRHVVTGDVGFYVVVQYALDRYRSDREPAEIPEDAWSTIIGEEVETVQERLDGPLPELRSYHETFHRRILREFSGVSEDELSAPSMYWEGYELSLRFRLHRFDAHMRQHTIQIEKTLEAIERPPNETKRLLHLIYGALADAEGATIGAWDVGDKLRRETAETIAARADEIAEILA